MNQLCERRVRGCFRWTLPLMLGRDFCPSKESIRVAIILDFQSNLLIFTPYFCLIFIRFDFKCVFCCSSNPEFALYLVLYVGLHIVSSALILSPALTQTTVVQKNHNEH